jgi:hypothetical protein
VGEFILFSVRVVQSLVVCVMSFRWLFVLLLSVTYHGRWFSPCTPASSTTKTGRRDIAEILLKVAFKHQKSINQSESVNRRTDNTMAKRKSTKGQTTI